MSLRQNLRISLRRLGNSPGFTTSTIVTLGVGIGVSVAVFALVDAVLLRPLPYQEAEQLVALEHRSEGLDLTMTGLSPGMYLHYHENSRVFEDLALYQERVRTVTEPGAGELIPIATVSPSIFSVLGTTAHLGRLPTAADQQWGESTGVLISHQLWKSRYGGDPGVIGRTLEVEGTADFIVGVAEPGFRFPSPETAAWSILDPVLHPASGRAGLRGLGYAGIARLRPGVTPEEAAADLERMIALLPEAFPDVTEEGLAEIRLTASAIPFREVVVGDVRVPLTLLAITAAFLLLITWANVLNLTLVRAEQQQRSAAVERALGAGRPQMVARSLGEGLLIGVAGGAVGYLVAKGAVAARFGFDARQIPRLDEVGVGISSLALIVFLAAASAALMSGAAFANVAGRPLSDTLGTATRASSGRSARIARRGLVMGQVALALTLMVGSVLMAQSFWNLYRVDPGFESDGGVIFRLPVSPGVYGGHYHGVAEVQQRVLERLRAVPGVEMVEATSASTFPLTPMPGYYRQRIAPGTEAGEPDAFPEALFGFATPGYFRAMGIPLVAGRGFAPDDTSLERPGVILSSSLTRSLFGDADPIGRTVRWAQMAGYPDYAVVGVVGDVPSERLRDGPVPAFYLPHIYPPRAETVTGEIHIFVPSDEVYVVRSDRSPQSLLPEIRAAVAEVDPRLVVSGPSTLPALMADARAETRLTLLLLLMGAGTALFLGLTGIYGVLSYSVRRRTPEMGIRLALGAQPQAVAGMVVREGAVLTLAGIAVGIAVALVLARYIRGLLYEVSVSDPLAFAGTAVLLLSVAMLAAYLPARRAARVDPMIALRAE